MLKKSPLATAAARPSETPTPPSAATQGPGAKREILVPASVRIAKEKAAAKLKAVRDRVAARAKLKAAHEERANTRAALRIAKALDRKAEQKERDAAKLDLKAQRIAFRLALKDKREELRAVQRARRAETKTRRGKAD